MKPFVIQVEIGLTPIAAGLLLRLIEAVAPTLRAAPIPDIPPEPELEARPGEAAPPATETRSDVPNQRVRRRWSEERKAVVRRDYPSGRDAYEILADLQALPGPEITVRDISTAARDMGFRRPWTARLAAPVQPAVSSEPPVSLPQEPEPADEPPAAADPAAGRRWSEERKAIVRRDWPAGRSTLAIREELLELPGPEMTRQQITVMAAQLGLKRPGVTGAAVTVLEQSTAEPEVLPTQAPALAAPDVVPIEPPAEPPRPASPPPAEPAAGVQRADYATILAWAGQRGLASVRDGMNLMVVNAKRISLGLGPFELLPRGRGRAAA